MAATLIHEYQHDDYPTWCIHCGTFSCYCKPEEPCNGERDSFDTRKPEVYRHRVEELFGTPLEETLQAICQLTPEQAQKLGRKYPTSNEPEE